MENLHISDAPPQQQQQQQQQPPPPQGHGRSQSQSQGQGQQDQPALGRSGAPSQPTQLPPQMFTTAAQLLDLTDKKLMVALRDGRKLIGVLRSWDQFANLVLQNTIERVFVHPPPPPSEQDNGNSNGNGTTAEASPSRQKGLYADINRGVFLVRGENVLLLGEIDLDKDDNPPPGYEAAEPELVHRLAEERKERDKVKDKARLRKLGTMGFEGENMGEVMF